MYIKTLFRGWVVCRSRIRHAPLCPAAARCGPVLTAQPVRVRARSTCHVPYFTERTAVYGWDLGNAVHVQVRAFSRVWQCQTRRCSVRMSVLVYQASARGSNATVPRPCLLPSHDQAARAAAPSGIES